MMSDCDLDAALVGLAILDEPIAHELTEEWIATPHWREAASILLRHRRRGGRLGNLIVAGEVLRRAHCDLLLCDVDPGADPNHPRHSGFDFPWTTAAEAACAVADCASPTVALTEAGQRLPLLQLRRLVQLFETLTTASLAGVYAALPRVRDAIAAIEANVGRFSPRLPTEPDIEARERARRWTSQCGPARPAERPAASPADERLARALGVEVER
jgi:hypothetical protein